MSSFLDDLKAALSPAYELDRELTGGGMSRVFVAIERSLGRQVVVKVLPPELTAGVNRERFRREIQLAAQLQHPHIVPLLSAGEQGDLLYYTMPYIEGESLRTALKSKGRFPVRDVTRILHDVVDALAYAHGRGVIHRDIKPGNILTQGAHALVTDFGVAKALSAALPSSGITSAGMAIGTPAYMAPEQLAGDPAADHRMDLYAVGLLAYELLIGESPFSGPSPQATLAAQLTRDPEPVFKMRPDVPPELSAVIMRCLAKLPEERPASAAALLEELEQATTPSRGSPASAGRTPEDIRRSTLSRIATAAALVIVFAAGLFASRSSAARSKAIESRHRDSSAAVAKTKSESPKRVVAAAKPARALTHEDSLAIAEAVRRRLADAEVARGTVAVKAMEDSIRVQVERMVMDSIIKVNIARGFVIAGSVHPAMKGTYTPPPLPPGADFPPEGTSGPRRVVITDPRESTTRPELNAFSRIFVDSLRHTLMRRGGYAVVDQDSVRALLSRTRVRDDVTKTLRPELLVSPQFLPGDSMTMMVSIRDVSGRLAGPSVRIATLKFPPNEPVRGLELAIRSVLGELEELRRTPRRYRVMTPAVPKPPGR
jgi:serine/threonine protein kinase